MCNVGFPNGAVTPASLPAYDGEDFPLDSTGNGSVQCGTFESTVVPPSNAWTLAVTEAVPSQAKCYLSGIGVTAVSNAKNQFKATVSLASPTLQLTGHVSTALNENTDPALGTYVWVSRNTMIATVSNTGLVSAIRRGEVEIECRYSRAANLPFPGSTPSQTESQAVYASLNLIVTA